MKLSIVSKDPKAPHVAAIVKAAKGRNLSVEVVNFHNLNELQHQAGKLGEVVYWRASNLGIKSERTSAFNYLKNKYLINKAIFVQPYVTHKLHQQTTVQAAGISGINTYKFRSQEDLQEAVKQGTLKLPFIAKPDLGAHGIGVKLVKVLEDIGELTSIKDLIFQDYIKNDGDWRVIMLGGRALGVIKRTAPPGSVLNNIFQGAQASRESDQETLKKVIDMASRATAALGLVFCGVDIIYDQSTGDYRLLEVNTAPEWLGGFQPTTGVNVAAELVNFVLEIGDRGQKPAASTVRDYYQNSLDLPGVDPDDIFHFASRLHLWGDLPVANKLIKKIRASYLGASSAEIEKKLTSYLTQDMPISLIPTRRDYFQKYPRLRAYNRILFKVLFAEKIYGLDLRDTVKKLSIENDMIKLYGQLLKDKKAVGILSTHAVNFIFLVNNFFGKQPDSLKLSKTLDYQKYLLGEAENLSKKIAGDSVDLTELRLAIYMISHVIIAASNFYQQPVTDPAYKPILERLEKALSGYYSALSLDIKLEFLVCATLCGYSTDLRPIIRSEAQDSLSEIGNFLVDTHNQSASTRPLKDRLWQSEHRSVLYLMTELPFQHGNIKV